MLNVEVSVDEGDWPQRDWDALASEAAREALRGSPHGHLVDAKVTCEISVKLSDDATVRALNAQFRHKDKPTNVLSFPAVQKDLLTGLANTDDGEALLGDIVLAQETCAREAAEKGVALEAHATHLIVHGALHLVGYDHQGDAEAEEMEKLETEILGKLGIADPYESEERAG